MTFRRVLVTTVTAYICAVLLNAIFLSADSADASWTKKDSFHIYLLIGQSNMAGRAAIEAEDEAPIERCYLLNDHNEWEVATNPLNRYSRYRKVMDMQRLNPGYGFAKKLVSSVPGITVGLVVSARGGTKVEQWQPGELLYEEAVARARIAAESGVLKGILWHQGEGNRDDPDYLAKVTRVIEGFRRDLGVPDLPFIAGQIRTNEDWAVNRQISALTGEVPHTACVGAEGLVTQDDWHFETESMRAFGERYADAVIEMLYR